MAAYSDSFEKASNTLTKDIDGVFGDGVSKTLAPGEGEASHDAERDNPAYSLFSVDKPLVDFGPDYGYDRVRIRRSEELSVYSESQDNRFAMDPRKRVCILMALALPVVLCVVVVLPDITFNDVSRIYGYHYFAQWAENLSENVSTLASMISLGHVSVQSVRMEAKICQYIICAFAGAGLAVTGAMFQGALRNAMVSPSTLGIMSGAQIGSALYILLGFYTPAVSVGMSMSDYIAYRNNMGLGEYIMAMYGQAIYSLLGAFASVMLVIGIAYAVGRGKVSRSALVIAGSVLASVVSGIVQLIRYYLTEFGTENQYNAVSSLATGSLSSWYQVIDVIVPAVPIFVLLLVLFKMRTRMNLLAFNDEEARSMGFSPQTSRVITIAACTILTAVIVAFCGSIHMVGFLVPLLVRKVSGPDFRYLVPVSMLAGALFTLLANWFSNEVLSGFGTGTVTGILGACAFVFTVIRQRKRGDVDWI